ncbi:MAG: SPOCS domain-containing protein [Oscillospiraceae bacterium]
MDFKVNCESMPLSETIFSGIQEQSIELEYILPDYFPDIFKIIKCRVIPGITSRNISSEKAVYEITVDIKVLYQNEHSSTIQCISQRQVYTKTIDFSRPCENAEVTICPEVDYVNCRAVNQRRIDIRGAVSVRVCAVCSANQSVICDASGMNIQLKKIPVEYISRKISAEKSVSINEELELNSAKPSVLSIIRSDVTLAGLEKKVIANKLVIKGEAIADILYTYENDSGNGMETMQYTIPYSQIIDADGIDESFECIVNQQAALCDISVTADSKGENRIFRCDIMVNISCSAYKSAVTSVVSDVYSTLYECMHNSSPIRSEKMPVMKSEVHQAKNTVEYADGNIECVYDMWCGISNVNAKTIPEKQEVFITGTLQYSVIVRNSDGAVVLIEKDEIFEHTMQSEYIGENSSVSVDIKPESCSYTLTDENKIALKCELRINSCIKSYDVLNAVTEIFPDENSRKIRDGDYALKLYYGIENEEIWSIAKRYSTSVDAIMEENDLDGDRLKQNGMLLIPITC